MLKQPTVISSILLMKTFSMVDIVNRHIVLITVVVHKTDFAILKQENAHVISNYFLSNLVIFKGRISKF